MGLQHNHFHHVHGKVLPPKGCMAVRVGREEEGEQERFVVPVVYLNHPLFIGLLKEAEEEYGFEHSGAITIPCHVEHFRQVQGIINRDTGYVGPFGAGAGAGAGGGHNNNHHHHHHHHHLPFHIYGCFKA